jgi:hypothetical protein
LGAIQGLVVHAERQDPGIPVAREDTPEPIGPARAGQGDVHDHDIRPYALIRAINRLGAVGLGGHDDPGALLEQRAQADADHAVVVDQQDPGRSRGGARRSRGICDLAFHGARPRPARQGGAMRVSPAR